MKKSYDFFSNSPVTFGLCFKSGCASADNCLRRLAFRDLNDSREKVIGVNPLIADTAGAGVCSLYRPAEPVRVAYGFSKALATVPKGRVKDVQRTICHNVCRRNYYYLLKGDKPLLPDMQRYVEDVLQQFGASVPVEFDRYESQYDW